MNNIKLILISIILIMFVDKAMCQTKIDDVKWKTTKLKAIKFESKGDFLNATIFSGYEYPSIQRGYNTVNIFISKSNLVDFYTELVNVSKSSKGEYKLTKKYGDIIRVDNLGKKLRLVAYSNKYKKIHFMKVKIRKLELDYDLIINNNWEY